MNLYRSLPEDDEDEEKEAFLNEILRILDLRTILWAAVAILCTMAAVILPMVSI